MKKQKAAETPMRLKKQIKLFEKFKLIYSFLGYLYALQDNQ